MNFALVVCDLENKVSQAKDALYKAYPREGRKDLISMIRFDDLLKIENFAINKDS